MILSYRDQQVDKILQLAQKACQLASNSNEDPKLQAKFEDAESRLKAQAAVELMIDESKPDRGLHLAETTLQVSHLSTSIFKILFLLIVWRCVQLLLAADVCTVNLG